MHWVIVTARAFRSSVHDNRTLPMCHL